MIRKPIVERAFELAQSGKFSSVTQVKQRLRQEGHTHATISAYLDGTVQRKLKALVAKSAER